MEVPLLDGFRADGTPDPEAAARAAGAWLAGGLVGLPTETVYGLAADAQDAEAVARIYAVKGRPADHPVIVHVQGVEALRGWSQAPNAAAEQLAAAFWPGALTVVVARSRRAGDFVTGGQDTVALRCPDHPVARACLRALAVRSGDPERGVAAPSANRFGRVSPTRAEDVRLELGARMDPTRDLVVDGGPCTIGVESTIVDCTATPPRVLRVGAIGQAQVDAVLAASPSPPRLRSSAAASSSSSAEPPLVGRASESTGRDDEVRDSPRNGTARAPGTLDSHYSPRARVLLAEPATVPRTGEALPSYTGSWGLIAPAGVATPAGCVRLASPASAEDYARSLYAALRHGDEQGLAVIVAVLPDPSGGPLALAVRDRLARAAHPGVTR